jgi:hypothetical protein
MIADNFKGRGVKIISFTSSPLLDDKFRKSLLAGSRRI